MQKRSLWAAVKATADTASCCYYCPPTGPHTNYAPLLNGCHCCLAVVSSRRANSAATAASVQAVAAAAAAWCIGLQRGSAATAAAVAATA